MKVLNVVGARPNMMKVAPIVRALGKRPGVTQKLVHTGQHFDQKMSRIFFDELGLPPPDLQLGVGGGTSAARIAFILEAFDSLLARWTPDVVVVVGDVDSTLACAIATAKRGIALAHVEAGLRSFDRSMPEEINRMVTDRLSDLLFTTSPFAGANLLKEGIAPEKVHFVGNVMIDTLCRHRRRAAGLRSAARFHLQDKPYAVATLHRPSNVDRRAALSPLVDALTAIARQVPVVFPVHPRTRLRLHEFDLWPRLEQTPGLHACEPLGYLPFLDLMMHSRLVLTDSGGVQEETTVLGIPCLTMRETTERPETVELGSNRLVGANPERILPSAREVLAGGVRVGRIPELWDGNAAERIVEILARQFG